MTFDELFPSNYLRQSDFPTPLVLVITNIDRKEIHRASGKEMESVLYFQGSKPMILNKTNGLVLCKLYGTDPAQWLGKEIEVYRDPGVMKGRERVGGIRLRKAAGPAARPAAATKPQQPQASKPTPAPAAAPKSTPPPTKAAPLDPLKIEQQYATALDVLSRAKTPAMLDEWARWIKKFAFSLDQVDELMDARDRALERIALASGPAARKCA